VRVALAAPTGRAAQRMGSLAGCQAQTIHRLLEFRPMDRRQPFGRNAERPLDTDVVIVDEVSMVDILLMRALMEAVPAGARVVFVGDSNQLPSVGPGNVLADMVACGRIPHVELTTLFRQAAASRIVTAAHQIMHGEVCRFANAAEENCFFVPADDPQQCQETVVDLVCNRLPKRYGLDARTDIQVLTPMHRGEAGTQSINKLLQQRLAPGGASIQRGEITFTLGDRVMQVRNNYDVGVFNGDIGFVTDISEDDVVRVDFGGTVAAYQARDLDELTHAYCISIHKSQGCEFPAVVIPLLTQHYVMLKRNLVYTALTRARKLCVFVGSARAFGMAVGNNDSMQRYSRLGERIRSGGAAAPAG
jgi:exodeoxyribonuclease V alpha subunit